MVPIHDDSPSSSSNIAGGVAPHARDHPEMQEISSDEEDPPNPLLLSNYLSEERRLEDFLDLTTAADKIEDIKWNNGSQAKKIKSDESGSPNPCLLRNYLAGYRRLEDFLNLATSPSTLKELTLTLFGEETSSDSEDSKWEPESSDSSSDSEEYDSDSEMMRIKRKRSQEYRETKRTRVEQKLENDQHLPLCQHVNNIMGRQCVAKHTVKGKNIQSDEDDLDSHLRKSLIRQTERDILSKEDGMDVNDLYQHYVKNGGTMLGTLTRFGRALGANNVKVKHENKKLYFGWRLPSAPACPSK